MNHTLTQKLSFAQIKKDLSPTALTAAFVGIPAGYDDWLPIEIQDAQAGALHPEETT